MVSTVASDESGVGHDGGSESGGVQVHGRDVARFLDRNFRDTGRKRLEVMVWQRV